MRFVKRIAGYLKDDRVSIDERMSCMASAWSILVFFVILVVKYFCGAKIDSVILMTAGIAILLLVFLLSLRFHGISIGTDIMALLMALYLLPVMFFSAGGIPGSAPVWFLFVAVWIGFAVHGTAKYVIWGILISVTLACYYIDMMRPEYTILNMTKGNSVDALASILLAGSSTCLMLLFRKRVVRQHQQLMEKKCKNLESLNKSQNRFFSNMSHEIRTPINTIIGLNEMILREQVSDEVAEDARNIQGASRMLLALINDVLDMSKMESGKMDMVPVNYQFADLVSEIVNMIWPKAKQKGLEFHVDVDETLPSQLYGDEVRIKQVLINLLNNAVKYTKEGRVSLSVQWKQLSDAQAEIIYSVSDTGMGIKRESLPVLFNVFQRLEQEKNRYIEGTGLGLSIVKQLVDLMGGEITVDSVYMRGSSFVVHLPQEIRDRKAIGKMDFKQTHKIRQQESYHQSFEAPLAHLLIVDDNKVNRMVEAKLLKKTKIQIDMAESGMECLEKSLHQKYDVIFMDHFMPQMDGIECLHALRKQPGGMNMETPVIILTANAGPENQELYYRNGFDGYLLKPVTGPELERKLLEFLPESLVNMTGVSMIQVKDNGPSQKDLHRVSMRITTDSLCDLPKWILEKYRISQIPCRVYTEEGVFLDGIDMDTEEVVKYMKDGRGRKIYSNAPSAEEYEKFFASQLDEAYAILHISISSGISDGYKNALEASKSFGNVTIIDSEAISCSIGLLCVQAAEYANENGMGVEQIVTELGKVKKEIRSSFLLDTTEQMMRTEFVGYHANYLANNLLLHPQMVLKKGKMRVKRIFKGTGRTCRLKYIAKELKKASQMDKRMIFVAYSTLDEEEKRDIESMIRNAAEFESIIFQQTSSAITTNCGPGAIGLLYKMGDV